MSQCRPPDVRISLLSAPDDPPVDNGALQATFGRFRQFLRICDIPVSTPMFYQDVETEGAAEGYAGEFVVPLPQTLLPPLSTIVSAWLAAAHCGVSLASAIRFAKRAGITDKRAKAKKNVRDNVLKAVKGGVSCQQAAAHYGVSPTTAVKWARNARIPRTYTSTNRISDDIRDNVLKAVEGGMSCRQVAAHCGVSVASAIRWTKHFRT
jgi:hypothetical protein